MLVHTLSHRIASCLERQGVLERDAENSWLTLEEEGEVLTQLQGASAIYRIASGPQQGLLSPQPVSGTSHLSGFLPRLAGVTSARCWLLGVKTPWQRVRLTRSLGTRAANLAMKSKGSNMTCVVPLR